MLIIPLDTCKSLKISRAFLETAVWSYSNFVIRSDEDSDSSERYIMVFSLFGSSRGDRDSVYFFFLLSSSDYFCSSFCLPSSSPSSSSFSSGNKLSPLLPIICLRSILSSNLSVKKNGNKLYHTELKKQFLSLWGWESGEEDGGEGGGRWGEAGGGGGGGDQIFLSWLNPFPISPSASLPYCKSAFFLSDYSTPVLSLGEILGFDLRVELWAEQEVSQ